MSDRTFTIQGSDIGYTGGVYKAKSPYRAAKKAARILFRAISNGIKYNESPKENPKLAKYAKFAKYKNEKAIKFLIRETTRGSEKGTFYYDAVQNDLEKPITVERNGVSITITKEVDVKTCHDAFSSLKI